MFGFALFRELPPGLASQVTQPLALLARHFRVEPDGSLWLVSPLGPQSGEPTSAAAGARPQTDRVLRVPVKAEDNGKPPLYNITLVTIIVTPAASAADSLLSASAVRIISNRGSASQTSDRVAGGAGSLGGGALLQVEEGAEPGTIVGFVLVNGDALTCSSASDLLALEYLPNAQRYSIKTTARQFDREREAIHELEIVCNERIGSAQSQPQSQSQVNSILGARTVRKAVTVEVLDANDERPTFEANPIELFVSENAPVGTRVGQLRATDSDNDPAHKRMEFALQPLPNVPGATATGAGAGAGAYLDLSRFRLDKTTGEIYTNEVFDRESRENYSFRVMVSDPTRPELNSTATVRSASSCPLACQLVVIWNSNLNSRHCATYSFGLAVGGACRGPQRSRAPSCGAHLQMLRGEAHGVPRTTRWTTARGGRRLRVECQRGLHRPLAF